MFHGIDLNFLLRSLLIIFLRGPISTFFVWLCFLQCWRLNTWLPDISTFKYILKSHDFCLYSQQDIQKSLDCFALKFLFWILSLVTLSNGSQWLSEQGWTQFITLQGWKGVSIDNYVRRTDVTATSLTMMCGHPQL